MLTNEHPWFRRTDWLELCYVAYLIFELIEVYISEMNRKSQSKNNIVGTKNFESSFIRETKSFGRTTAV